MFTFVKKKYALSIEISMVSTGDGMVRPGCCNHEILVSEQPP